MTQLDRFMVQEQVDLLICTWPFTLELPNLPILQLHSQWDICLYSWPLNYGIRWNTANVPSWELMLKCFETMPKNKLQPEGATNLQIPLSHTFISVFWACADEMIKREQGTQSVWVLSGELMDLVLADWAMVDTGKLDITSAEEKETLETTWYYRWDSHMLHICSIKS